ncbi:isoprenylcysteine alpha-carbonyl methylesterase ICMEL2 [Fusarium subglutinans]|uniref:Isoprenylcysteine alpha-carbonyl methylesterase ICMEL2 n=1 Tax=Gibberella subglutinans TaxID=42677 RepID=A0A8H5Q8K9_GIBSU|nr:isoprenylcysteine alpha-carbonyl methylesterase ICMEL2 [Fusarium subglutinans]KAF5610229.1 isoprenylcysteine alpha-carbonyl methylesterase ICMEL2 [Fusarium subglutinans]
MDQPTSVPSSIAESIEPTLGIYLPLLNKNSTAIKSTLRKTFSYGPNPRNNLDIYYPANSPTGAGCPVFIYTYGGGFTRETESLKIIYSTETLGISLLRSADNNDKIGGSQPRPLFMMGNSAGAVHLCTFLLHPSFAELRGKITGTSDTSPLQLKAAVFCSMPTSLRKPRPYRAPVLARYYGETVEQDCPLGLLEACNKDKTVSDAAPGVQFLLLYGSLDPEDEILGCNKVFIELWRSGKGSSGVELEVQVMEGHNHISSPPALGTNISREEVWGFNVAGFCNAAVRS